MFALDASLNPLNPSWIDLSMDPSSPSYASFASSSDPTSSEPHPGSARKSISRNVDRTIRKPPQRIGSVGYPRPGSDFVASGGRDLHATPGLAVVVRGTRHAGR